MRRAAPLLGLLLAAAAPAGLGAQVTGPSSIQNVEDKEAAYDLAKKKYGVAGAEAERLRNGWNQLLAQHTAASLADDENRVRQLLADFEERSGEKNRAENAWRTSRKEWIEAGEALISAIDAHLEMLWLGIELSVGSSEDADNQYTEYADRLDKVEREIEEAREPLELGPMPEVTIGEDDTPREILYKASVIDNRVKYYERLLDDLKRELAALIQRQRREQKRRDILGGRERFSEVSAPIGDQRRNPGAAGVTGRILEPLEVRIEKREALRDEVENRMKELKQKADLFRQRAGGRS